MRPERVGDLDEQRTALAPGGTLEVPDCVGREHERRETLEALEIDLFAHQPLHIR